LIAACLKWVDRRPEVDPLDAAATHDRRTSGPSDADQAALEWALRLGEAWSLDVVAVTAGPTEVEPMLRAALAAGATSTTRIDLPFQAASEEVAAALVAAVPTAVDVVVCGAWSPDRGSGSVPAYLAAGRNSRQALGLVGLAVDDTRARTVLAERRLDGGRRERLRVTAPAVLSVEGGLRLRRASLSAVLRAREAPIEVVPMTRTFVSRRDHVATAPFRPRARVLPGPDAALDPRQRILALTGALADRDPPRLVRLDPGAAADELLEQLRAWGYT
jgi:electron transfer flavoprotein beta subunit